MKFDKTQTQAAGSEVQNPVDEVQKPVVSEDNDTKQNIPKHRFDEVNNLMKDYKAKLDELESQIEQQKRAELEKTQQFEQLYKTTAQELESIKNSKETSESKLSEYESVVSKMLEAKLETIPDEFKALVPDSYSPTQKLEWLNKAEQGGLFKKNGPVGKPMNGDPNPTADTSAMSAQQKMALAYQNNGTSRIKGM